MNTSAVRNISIIQGALVGSSKENIDLLDRRTGEWGFSTISNPLDISSPNYIEKVRAINVKSIINEYKNIGIFKIDIEGGEVDLFDCASNELSNIPVIFIEIHERIKPGSMETFINFSKNRHIVELGSNKFLSIKKTILLEKNSIMLKNFFNISDINENYISKIINPLSYSKTLKENIGLLFEKQSTRTRLSFSVGISRLGGNAIDLKIEELNSSRHETFEDTFKAFNCYLDGLIYRTQDHKRLIDAEKYFEKPIINALSDIIQSDNCRSLYVKRKF